MGQSSSKTLDIYYRLSKTGWLLLVKHNFLQQSNWETTVQKYENIIYQKGLVLQVLLKISIKYRLAVCIVEIRTILLKL